MTVRTLLSGLFLPLLFACSGEAPPSQAPVGAEPAGSDVVAETPVPSEANNNCQLVMGWDPYEPYQYADQDGTLRGLDVELVSEMAKQVGCQLSFKQQDWSTLISELRSGNIGVLAGASKVAERESFAYFSQPYRQETFVLYVRAGEVERWQGESLADLVGNKKMRVGITDGYIYGPEIDKLLDDTAVSKRFVSAPFSEAHAANLIDKRIDGMLEDPFVATAMIRRKQLSDDIIRGDTQITTGDVSLMFSKAAVSAETVSAFDEALKAMRADGRYEAIIKRYQH